MFVDTRATGVEASTVFEVVSDLFSQFIVLHNGQKTENTSEYPIAEGFQRVLTFIDQNTTDTQQFALNG